MAQTRRLPPYHRSMAGTLLAAREAVMAPLRPVLREAGVTEQQWRILRVLADLGPTDCIGIANAALLLPPSVTRIVKELTERGLVVRGADIKDARRIRIAISAQGEALMQSTSRHTLAVLGQYRMHFGDERFEALQNELRAFTTAIQACVPPDQTASGLKP